MKSLSPTHDFSCPSNPSCHYCGKPLKGRPDKMFCSTQCKNTYNNRRRSSEYPFVLDAILHRNRSILKRFHDSEEKESLIPYLVLEHAGFQFEHLTGIKINAVGSMTFYVYEYGWEKSNNDYVLITGPTEHNGEHGENHANSSSSANAQEYNNYQER